MAKDKEIFDQIFKDLFPDIKDVADDQTLPDFTDNSEANDNNMLFVSKHEDAVNGIEYSNRDKIYTQLLKHYKDTFQSKSKWNKWYKLSFFVLSMLVFVGIIVASVGAICFVALKQETSMSDVSVVVGSTAGIVSSIIVLPRIIAEHLFPTNEDANMNDMVKNMQVNDSKIRTLNKKSK